MSVTIQDDMMAAAVAMPRKQGDAFLVALLRYGFLGEDPGGKQPWYPTFITCKDRVDLSVKRSNTGAGRKSKAQAPQKSNAGFDCNQTQDLIPISEPDNRDEMSRDEMSREKKRDPDSKSKPKSSAEIAEVIAHLNEVCGTGYDPGSDTSRKYVGARLGEGFTVDDCKRVIDNMAAQWLDDDRMRRYLRPSTLFRKEKFEGYLNQGLLQARGGERYAEYD